MLEYVIVGAIVGGFIGLIVALSKKQNNEDMQIVSAMPQNIKDYLMQTPMRPVQGMPNAAAVAGYVYRVNKQSDQYVWFKVMYYNQYFPSLRDMIISCDVKVPIADAQMHGVQPNCAVTLLFNEDKNPQLIF